MNEAQSHSTFLQPRGCGNTLNQYAELTMNTSKEALEIISRSVVRMWQYDTHTHTVKSIYCDILQHIGLCSPCLHERYVFMSLVTLESKG